MTHFHVRMFFGRAALFCFALARSAQAQAWVQLQPHGTPPQGRINNTAVYDSVTQRLIIFGGFDTGTCCHGTNDVWVLTNADSVGGPREWINLIPANAPGSPPPRSEERRVGKECRSRWS